MKTFLGLYKGYTMKVICRIVLLTVITLTFPNLYAGRNNYHNSQKPQAYKMANPRQQKQVALQTTQYVKRMAEVPTMRHERRHTLKSTILSTGQKALLIGLTIMLLTPCIIAKIPDKPSMIYTIPYSTGTEAKTYGSCTTLPDNSILCCDIGKNLTVTCCARPRRTEYRNALIACAAVRPTHCHPVSYCISYDIEGIEGDQAVYKPINLTATSIEADQECATAQATHYVAYEVIAFEKDFASTAHDHAKDSTRAITFLLSNGTSAHCAVPITGITKTGDLPIFTDMVEELCEKLNIPKKKAPSITVIQDQNCDRHIQQAIGLREISMSWGRQLTVYTSLLQNFTDNQLAGLIAHEIFHIIQPVDWDELTKISKAGNNVELEADLASILATNSTCIPSFLKRASQIKVLLPTITRENAADLLKPEDPDDPDTTHPSIPPRISFNLAMSVHTQRAIAYLLEFLHNKPQWFEN